MKTAATPFRFFAHFSLTLATGRSAASLQELRDGVSEAPDESIHQHTHRFIAGHQSLVPEPSNDLSVWVDGALGRKELAARLAEVDVFRFGALADLRRALIRTIDDELKARGDAAAPPENHFHFLSRVSFSTPTGAEARTLSEFMREAATLPPASLFLHLYEARLRPPLGVNDFSQWLSTEMDEPELAQAVAGLDLYAHTMEQVRAALLDLLRSRVEFDAARKGAAHASA